MNTQFQKQNIKNQARNGQQDYNIPQMEWLFSLHKQYAF